ncbi:MAG TPA: TlpA disulfide reductase family protein [Gemmatirosa sp.]|nr:TlpA disulfide reductase family protein [Gemmatirosa sp.]
MSGVARRRGVWAHRGTAATAAALLAGGLATAGCGARDAADRPTGADTAAAAGGGEGAFRPLAAGDPAPAYAARAVYPTPLPAGAGAEGDSLRVGPGQTAPTLVSVWATWCTTCREEFALLDSLQQEYAPRGLRIMAVSVDRGPSARVARFAESYRARFPIAHDPEGRIEDVFRVVGVPESYLVGRDGRVRWRHAGAIDASARAEVERALE